MLNLQKALGIPGAFWYNRDTTNFLYPQDFVE